MLIFLLLFTTNIIVTILAHIDLSSFIRLHSIKCRSNINRLSHIICCDNSVDINELIIERKSISGWFLNNLHGIKSTIECDEKSSGDVWTVEGGDLSLSSQIEGEWSLCKYEKDTTNKRRFVFVWWSATLMWVVGAIVVISFVGQYTDRISFLSHCVKNCSSSI